ncbi:hypothetical protein SBA4_2340016 [Candidatus Sulfopaludibacter sp. SbA4]|nr:hypothetical protein SBA4_2340016 [Candidatus Sulfopaludibacter sp. SbA4]
MRSGISAAEWIPAATGPPLRSGIGVDRRSGPRRSARPAGGRRDARWRGRDSSVSDGVNSPTNLLRVRRRELSQRVFLALFYPKPYFLGTKCHKELKGFVFKKLGVIQAPNILFCFPKQRI